jgi:cellulose synthase operon protein C
MIRRFGPLSTIRWPGRFPRGFTALGLAVGLTLLAIIPAGIAQSVRRSQPGLQNGVRALNEGRYDEVAGLTAELDQQDPAVAALRARAQIARGHYQEAEATLRPVAERASGSEAALELGLLLQMLGRPDAASVLVRVASAPASAGDAGQLGREARALRALGRFEDANAAYRDAVAAAPSDPVINTGWGELFLQTYNMREAMQSFKAALDGDPKWVPALVGSARALADDNPPQAVAMAQAALKISPADVGAHVFLAGQAIDAGKRPEGRELLQKALAVNPSSLDARSLLAGLSYIEDKESEFKTESDRVLQIAPRHGEVFRVAGNLAARNYRFEEAVALTRRALQLEPNNPRALGDLGQHLLRTGDERAARAALEASFKLDGFNVVTFNLLEMMDNLDKFVTVEAGDVILKMHPDEAPVLQDYALRIARQALDTVSARYQFKVQGPILIEIFPKHDDFAVRTLGLPGMTGALGVCFGKVVTMDSPRARPPGDFQWEATLWHELAHVVTLQMSKQRVPRWLTEGISEYEETIARPNEWGRPMELEFAQILDRGEALKLSDLNAAFTDPRTISLAYYQASLLVEHIVQAHGDEGLRRLVSAFADGVDSDAALKTALGTSFDQLQPGFDQMIDRRFGALRAAMKAPETEKLAALPVEALRKLGAENPKSFPVQMLLARALRKDGDLDEAVKILEQASALVPIARGPESPRAQLAEIALERKDTTRAIAALESLVSIDHGNIEAARQLAGLLRDAKITDPVRVRPVYERIAAVDPFDAQAHSVLGRLALDRGDAETAIREFRAVVALKPVDGAAAHTDLAESYLKGGHRTEARKQTLAALEIAPSYERAQNLLLALSEAR